MRWEKSTTSLFSLWAECTSDFYGENCAQECGAGCYGNCHHVTGCECRDWWVEDGTCDTEVTGEDMISIITMLQQLNLASGTVHSEYVSL